MKFEVGKKVWKYDPNLRVYEHEDGARSLSPIYRKSFREYYIVAETRVSWLISYTQEPSEWQLKQATKIKKSEADKVLFATEDELDKHCWCKDNAYDISEKVRRCNDFYILKKIEELLQ